MIYRGVPDSDRESHSVACLCDPVPGLAAGGGESDLSPCGWKFRGPSVHVGAVCSHRRRQSHGNYRDADLYSIDVCDVQLAAGLGECEIEGKKTYSEPRLRNSMNF